ncbi:MAG: heme-binding domain-containing protein [Ginsengibacter sp.]
MSRFKKILLGLFGSLIIIQFIRPGRNKSDQVLATDFTKIFSVPADVQSVLQNTCYDCHSNNTHYPWYFNIQPVAWIMASHIKNGRKELNFSEFGNYTQRRQASKLKDIADQVKDGEMPLSSYKLMHRNARLSEDQKVLFVNWMKKMSDSLSSGE